MTIDFYELTQLFLLSTYYMPSTRNKKIQKIKILVSLSLSPFIFLKEDVLMEKFGILLCYMSLKSYQ